jgi:F420H(2)-dependent quinone reductase
MWNLAPIRCQAMVDVPWDKFPLVAGHEHARRWLQFTANIGRAATTIDAYGRAVEDHLRFCALVDVEPLTIRADVVAAWIGDMFERPNPRSSKVVHLSSGASLANATMSAAGRGTRGQRRMYFHDGEDNYRVRATQVADDAERDRLYAQAVAIAPGFGDYAKETTRSIPVLRWTASSGVVVTPKRRSSYTQTAAR